MAYKFGKKFANLSLKFGVLFVGEIDQCIFLCAGNFLLGKKSLVKLTPGGQVGQDPLLGRNQSFMNHPVKLGYNEHPVITNKMNSFGWFQLI